MYVLVSDNKVLKYPFSLPIWRIENPRISLPALPTDEQLAEQGIFPVSPVLKPNVNYKKDVIEKNPTLVSGAWLQTWEVIDATSEEIQLREEQIIKDNQEKAMSLLFETDWTQISDVNLLNKAEFAAYRSALRQIVFTPSIDSVFPVKPDEDWNIVN